MSETTTITPRQEAEAFLRTSREQYRAGANSIRGVYSAANAFLDEVIAELDKAIELYEASAPIVRDPFFWRVGDKVRLTGAGWYGRSGANTGDAVTILRVDHDGDGVFEDTYGESWYVIHGSGDYDGEIIVEGPEAVERTASGPITLPPQVEETPTFKPGDLVRRKANAYASAYHVGLDPFTVVHSERTNDKYVRDQYGQGHSPENLELLDPEIHVGDTVRISATATKHNLLSDHGNVEGAQFVVTGIETAFPFMHGNGTPLSTFYVTGDPARRGVWEQFIEKVHP